MRRRVTRCLTGALLTGLLAWPLSGCAGGPPTVSPGGVDGLTVPTPSPDPADFTARVDNPYLPLAPRTRWTYRTTGTSGTTGRLVVRVLERTETVAGVATTVVRETSTGPRGRVRGRVEKWYAQDGAGNVWLFGRRVHGRDVGGVPTGEEDGSWRAGADGAAAGLVMAARPRVGDGYILAPGVRAEVASVDEQRTVPSGTYDDLVQLEVTPVESPGLVTRAYYAAGTGLVSVESALGTRAGLVDARPPAAQDQSG